MNIGIIGDGQLGRMLAIAGYPLGLHFGFLGDKNSPSGNLGKVFATIEELDDFADVITYESENTSLTLLQDVVSPVYPPINALKITQNRLFEKQLFAKLDIPTTQNIKVCSLQELQQGVAKIGIPCILKTNTEGYDGKGQYFLKNVDDIAKAWNFLEHKELLIEGVVNFDYEISMIAAFSNTQEVFYPITKNTHNNGILDTSEVIEHNIIFEKAKNYLKKIAQEFNYTGILTVEFFVTAGSNELIANEIAPRVHNSGHWSIDGARVSQFENHLRAICNLPLGSTQKIYDTIVMKNIISTLPDTQKILEDNSAFLHLYDKEERENRKLGHINYCKNN